MTCKEEFESHIRSLSGDYNLLMVGDVYIDVETQIEWRTWQKAWQAAIASQKPADDGWIEWAGGVEADDQPVDGMVEVNYRNGVISKRNAAMAAWHHEGIESDIIAYRVVKP